MNLFIWYVIPTDIINQFFKYLLGMARLSSASTSTYIRDQPSEDKIAQALEWLRENPDEKPTTVARLHYIENK